MISVFNFIRVKNMIFEFMTEVTDSTRYRPGCSIAKRTDGIAFNLACNIYQQIYIAHISMTIFYAMKHLFHPSSAFTTWAALAAAFMMIKLSEIPGITHDASGLIINNKPA